MIVGLGEGRAISANYIFVPDAFLRQKTPTSLDPVVGEICEICGLPLIFMVPAMMHQTMMHPTSTTIPIDQ